MKKTVIVGSVTTLLFIGLGTVAAPVAFAAAPSVQQLKAEIDSRKATLAAERASTTAEIKAKAALTAITKTVKAAQVHFQAEIDRLAQIKTRIDSRMTKLSQSGDDVTLAQSDLTIALTDLNGIPSLATSTPTTTAATVKQTVKSIQSAIDAAQAALLKVVIDMAVAVKKK